MIEAVLILSTQKARIIPGLFAIQVIGIYHIIGFAFTYIVVNVALFALGEHAGGAAWSVFIFLVLFMFQVALTTPIVFWLLRKRSYSK